MSIGAITMNIIIFGGNGFIGRVLQEKVKNHGHEFSVLDLPEEDILKPETFADKVKSFSARAIINMAGVLGGVKDAPPVQKMFEVNAMGNLKLLEVARLAGVKNYIFMSSPTVHGENTIGSHQERFSPFNPKHGYGASKAAAELSMKQFAKENPKMKITAVRPTMVLGQNAKLPHAPVDFIKTVISGKPIEIYGAGHHEREWIWIDDVAEGITRSIEYCAAAEPGYYPLFLSGNRIAMRDLAEKVASKLGGKVVFTPSTKQSFTLTTNYEESQKILNWRPQNDINDIIEKLIIFLKKSNRENDYY